MLDGQLAGGEATVAVEQLSVDPLALLGEQEAHEVCGVGWCSESAGGLHGDELLMGASAHPPCVYGPWIDDVGAEL